MKKHHSSALFPNMEERAQVGQHLTASIDAALAKVAVGSVSPTLDIPAFTKALDAFDFSEPHALTAIADWVIDNMSHGQVHMTHPRYFGLFNPAPTYPSECADQIAAAFNPQICVWSHAPVAVEIERHVIAQLAARLGMSADAGGHFTSGGSEANHTAVICALTRATSKFASVGARAFTGQPKIYASKESHLAWLKIAHESGIGRDAVSLIQTNGTGRMDANMLQQAIENDVVDGHVPVMIAATAGTTNAGMVDPLVRCKEIAQQFGLWLHVDAAWGGALVASDTLCDELDGIGTADSVTIDAHKWFATTMGAGMFLTAHQSVLADAFNVTTSYMPSNDQSVDLYVNSMQWSRRFLGLRLFLALAVAGWQGYAEHVERGVALIERLNDTVRCAGWQVANSSRMAVSCLIPPTANQAVADIVSTVIAGNQHWVSMTTLEGTPVVRVCITNGRTSADDIDALAVTLIAAGNSSGKS